MSLAPLLLSAAAALAAPQDRVTAEASVRPAADGGPGAVEVVIEIDVADGWHVYHPEQDPSVPGILVSAELSGDFEVTGELRSLTDGKPHLELIGQQALEYLWLGDATLVVPAQVTGAAGERTGELVFGYQACNDQLCEAPASITLPVRYTLDEAVAASEADDAGEEDGDAPQAAAPGDTIAATSEGSAAADAGGGQEPATGPEARIRGQEIEVRARFTTAKVASGGQGTLEFLIEVGDGYHIYAPEQDPDTAGIPFQITEIKTEGFALADGLETIEPEAEVHAEPWGTYLWLLGSPVLRGAVDVTADPGDYEVAMELTWQVCDESICLETAVKTIAVPVTVVQGEGAAGGSARDDSAINVDAGDVLKSGGFWSLMLAALAAGIATLATPCVFPMIPITVSFFTKRAEQGKGTPMGNATAYAGGIVLTFVGLGLGAAAILGASGANQIASNPWVNLMIAGLFVVLAASLLGFFEIQPPKFLANFASKAQSKGQAKGGYLPVVVMAFAFSVTAFTCTVGFVGGLLGIAAAGGQWWYAAAAMTVYAVVFALPFFLLAMFPSALQKMPTAGGWMNAVKVSFGYIELIAAWKFLSSAERYWDFEVLTRPVVILLTAIPLLLWAGYMFGLYTTKGDYGQKPPRSAPRALVGVVALAAGVYVLSGFPRDHYQYMWMEAYLPPKEYGAPVAEEDRERIAQLEADGQSYGLLEMSWYESVSGALEAGREQNALVFLDFTGVTCVNCLRMEGNIFPKPEVRDRLATMVRGHLYVDKPPFGKENSAFQVERLRVSAQPYYVVMDPTAPQGDQVLSTFAGYDPDPAEFVTFLDEAIQKGRKRGLTSFSTE